MHKNMELCDLHTMICNELHDLWQKKNALYGDSFAKQVDEYGLIVAAIRIAYLAGKPDLCFFALCPNYI